MEKILFVADVPIKNPSSGSEQVLNNQAVGLSEEGFDVFAVTRQNGKLNYIEFRDVMGIREACYFADVENLLSFIFSLCKKPVKIFDDLATNDPFYIAICHQPFTYFALLARGKLKNTSLIYVFHSPNHEEYLICQRNKNSIHKFAHAQVRKWIERYCLRRSEKIVVLSEYMKKKVIEIHKIPQEKIVVNAGGVDLYRFYPVNSRYQAKGKLNFPPKKVHLLTVRNLEVRMGIDNLIKAIYLLRKNGSNVHLTIGGDGPEKRRLECMVKELRLTKDVTMTGFIPSDLLPQYYSAADFFILPTRHLEGFGLVTVESLACGTPVLGTPVGGTKEILSNFYPEFLFKDSMPEDMADGIEKAIDNWLKCDDKYAQLRDKCRDYVAQNYSWQRHVSVLKEVIDGISPT